MTVVAFVCSNCARGGVVPSVMSRTAPVTPNLDWPAEVKEIIVPCSGRLAPEHVLKSFEDGADAVAILACDEQNCHYLEGSCRAGRRADYLNDILGEIGMGKGRLMLFHLPGSAQQDMAMGASLPAAPLDEAEVARRLTDIRTQVTETLKALGPSPLHHALPDDQTESSCEVNNDDSDD